MSKNYVDAVEEERKKYAEDLLERAKTQYQEIKDDHPLNTKLKPGVNLEEVIKAKDEKIYLEMKMLNLDFSDVDGVLDLLYGAKFFNPTASWIKELIDTIEKNCILE